jgi:antitoxin component YwqK of YwqJK toxin-antitoxin module
MAPKALSVFNVIFAIISLSSCQNNKEKESNPFSLLIDISMIPKDTIRMDIKNLKLDNGVYYLNQKAFSGFIEELDSKKTISMGSYLNGKQEGITKTYYPNRAIRDNRSYKDGKAFGRHFGNWQNGKIRFDFNYVNEKREGLQKQWYETGAPYAFLTFKNDREDGMQKAWRENGKLYINYEAKDGFRYGLQKSALCYTLRKEKLKAR